MIISDNPFAKRKNNCRIFCIPYISIYKLNNNAAVALAFLKRNGVLHYV